MAEFYRETGNPRNMHLRGRNSCILSRVLVVCRPRNGPQAVDRACTYGLVHPRLPNTLFRKSRALRPGQGLSCGRP